MNHLEYQFLVQRTECNQVDSLSRITDVDFPFRGVRLLHACIGMQGDLFELQSATSVTNKKEELGDMFWYVAEAMNAMNFRGSILRTYQPGDPSFRLIKEISLFSSLIEKRYYYGHDKEFTDKEIVGSLIRIYHSLGDLCNLNGFSVSDVLTCNIDKLKIRYPHKFTQEDESNRDRQSEADAMNED